MNIILMFLTIIDQAHAAAAATADLWRGPGFVMPHAKVRQLKHSRLSVEEETLLGDVSVKEILEDTPSSKRIKSDFQKACSINDLKQVIQLYERYRGPKYAGLFRII